MKPMFDRYIKRFNDLSPLIKEDFPAGYGSYMIVKDSDGEYYLQFVEQEEKMATFIDAEFFRKVDEEYPNFTDYQKQHYQLALLEQAIYVFKNGDISVDSGYDYDEGVQTSGFSFALYLFYVVVRPKK